MKKEALQVREMFASIAHWYDFLNHLLSFSMDRLWRRSVVHELAAFLPETALVLDLCTGTCDLALALASRARVVGCDFCHPMLVLGQQKVRKKRLDERIYCVEGDALNLPFQSQYFDAVTIAFGLRNLEDTRVGLREMFRVLRDGGTLAILEFSQPKVFGFRQIYLVYFRYILPRLGALISRKKGPYSYLPKSVETFLAPDDLREVIEEEGFIGTTKRMLTGGVASLHLAYKPAQEITGRRSC